MQAQIEGVVGELSNDIQRKTPLRQARSIRIREDASESDTEPASFETHISSVNWVSYSLSD